VSDVTLPNVRLYRGDTLDRMAEVESGSVDAIVADLPYGTTACAWDSVIPFEPLWDQYRRILKPKGAVILTACQPFTTALVNSNPKWFRYELVWDKVAATGFLDAKRRPMRAHENILVFARGYTTYNPQFEQGRPYRQVHKAWKIETIGDKKALQRTYVTESDGRRYPRSIVRCANPNSRRKEHPTQKPVDLFRWLVRTYTNPGETVLDNTMGSGTTGVASVLELREFIGIERDPVYFEIAERRIRGALEA
jgi:site-specific DNA-methyltransferase (adenine-specific)